MSGLLDHKIPILRWNAIKWERITVLSLALVFVKTILVLFLFIPVSSEVTDDTGLKLLSRNGNTLRYFRDQYGSVSSQRSLNDYPEHLRRAIILAEDKRFYSHPGFDPFAMARSVPTLLTGRLSGASTITQQLARSIFPMPENPYARKPVELLQAIRLEVWLSKDEILEAYMNRIAHRHNRSGMEAAARHVFQKDPSLLTVDESIALAVLIQSPHPTVKDLVLRMERLRQAYEDRYGFDNTNAIKPSYEQMAHSILAIRPLPVNQHFAAQRSAPHFTDFLRQQYPGIQGRIRTTLSSDVNARIESIMRMEIDFLREGNAEHAAAVVIHIPTGELIGLVGSPDFLGEEGQVNGVFALRDAGSTLKPFIYALAFDNGFRSYDLIDDSDLSLASHLNESYRPRNYDLNYWGMITLKEALAASRNIPAVDLADRLGIPFIHQNFRLLGMNHLEADPDHYGPGIALGTGGVRLIDLTRAYAAFMTEGELRPLLLGNQGMQKLYYGNEEKVFSRDAAFRIIYILADRNARMRAFGQRSFLDFPFDVAAKTGTSKDYRDSWTIGFTSEYAVGVWVGNFSGNRMRDISGAWGAGRIFQQIMRYLHDADSRHRFQYSAAYEEVSYCTRSGRIAVSGCPSQIHLVLPEESEICHGHGFSQNRDASSGTSSNEVFRIFAPAFGEEFILDPHIPREAQAIPLHIRTDEEIEMTYRINDGPLQTFRGSIHTGLDLDPGRYVLTVSGAGLEKQISFSVR